MQLLIPLLLLLLSIPLVLGLLRINELFVLRIRGGRVRVIRGRIPPKLLGDIRDIMQMANERAELSGSQSIELRGVSEEGRAKLYAHGVRLPRGVRQQLRNTVALWPIVKIRSAPKTR